MVTVATLEIGRGIFPTESPDAWLEMGRQDPEEGGELADQIVALRSRLMGFAWSLTRDHQSAEDLAQETIARAIASQWRFQPGTNLKAWLFRILRNLHLNTLRAAAAHPAFLSIDDLAGEPIGQERLLDPVEARVIERAEMEQIVAAYRTLPPTFALPLYLTAVEGLSYAEAASVLDVPVGTVMSRLYRAPRLLVARLGGGRP